MRAIFKKFSANYKLLSFIIIIVQMFFFSNLKVVTPNVFLFEGILFRKYKRFDSSNGRKSDINITMENYFAA